MDIFLEPEDFRFYLKRLRVCKEEYGFELYAVCLMTNHYHLIIRDVGLNLPMIMDSVNSVYVRYFNDKYNRKGPLFGEPFKHGIISSDYDLAKRIRYVNRNPVAAGMSRSIYDYSWVLIITEKDYLHLINFDYIDEVFLKVCKTSYEEYLKSDEDDLWVDEIEICRMYDSEANKIFELILTKITNSENFNKKELTKTEIDKVIKTTFSRGITIRQISKLTDLSISTIRKFLYN